MTACVHSTLATVPYRDYGDILRLLAPNMNDPNPCYNRRTQLLDLITKIGNRDLRDAFMKLLEKKFGDNR